MKHFLDNVELWLSGVGLLLIGIIPLLFYGSNFVTMWPVAAVTAISVGLLHGLIFWLVRRRQRTIRNKTIQEIRGMLKDMVNNQLTVIMMSAPTADQLSPEQQAYITHVNKSATKISKLLDTLSEETLKDWQVHYGEISS